MSLLIKGMDMPKRCLDCPCYDWSDEVCRGEGVAEAFIIENSEERSEFCPLIEIPTPHGRLIDVDALNQKIIETVNSGKPDENFTARDVIQLIEYAPTTIEAEGENDKL